MDCLECLRSLQNSLGVLPLVAAWATATEGAGEGKVHMLLAVYTHHERCNVDHLLADTAGGRAQRVKAGAC